MPKALRQVMSTVMDSALESRAVQLMARARAGREAPGRLGKAWLNIS